MKTTRHRLLLIRLACLGLLCPTLVNAEPAKPTDMQEARWGFATDLDLWTGTTNNTTFALGFGLDYYMTRIFRSAGWLSSRRPGT